MTLAHIDFPARGLSDERLDEFRDAVSWYGACLWKNGQINDFYFAADIPDGLRLVVDLIGAEARLPEHHAGFGREAFDGALAACRPVTGRRIARPRWVIEGTDDFSLADPAEGPQGLYIRSPYGNPFGNTPLRTLGGNLIVPTYRLPILHFEREHLTMWYCQYDRLFDVWMHTGELEMESYRAVVDPRGTFIEQGREYAAAIEAAMAVPTYLELERYYSPKRGDDHDRPCPGCGRQWRDRAVSEPHGSAFFFRCDRCRFVSEPGISPEVARIARIGEWGEPRSTRAAIASASGLVRAAKRAWKRGRSVVGRVETAIDLAEMFAAQRRTAVETARPPKARHKKTPRPALRRPRG